MKQMKQRWKSYAKSVMRVKTSPHAIALGFSLGTFIGILPSPGVSFLLGFLCVFLFPKISKFSLFGAIILWNPIVQIPIYAASYMLGDFLLGDLPQKTFKVEVLNIAYTFTRRFLIGNIIIALSLSLLSYPLVRGIVSWIQRKKKK
jgi:uncharacterized protein